VEPVGDVGPPKGSRNNPTGKAREANADDVRISKDANGIEPTGAAGSRSYGNSSDYWLGRIKKAAETNPLAANVLRRLEAAEYSSVHRAAVDARVKREATPEQKATRALKRLTPESRAAVVREVVPGIDAPNSGAPTSADFG
jgi:hypothetical protein